MEIETVENQQTIETLPVIETEEELQKYLGDDATQGADDGKQQQQKPAAPAKGQQQQSQQQQQQKPKPAAAKEHVAGDGITDGNQEGDDDGQGTGTDDNTGGKKPSAYPTLVHYLNEVNELGLNLDPNEQMTSDEQAEVVSEVYRRLVDGTNKALREQAREYQEINQLMQDEEFREFMEAKKSGKGLKDLFDKFNQSPLAATDDALAVSDFKKRYPKSSDEAINAMIDSLKKSGQFAPFVQGLRDQYKEESTLALENERRAAEAKKVEDAKKAEQELQKYASYLGGLTNVHGIPITDEMKDVIWSISTQTDDTGSTQLEKMLQSDEGTVLASIGIALLKEVIAGAGSLTGNRKNNKLMSKLFDSADKLQSSGSGVKPETDDEDYKLLNNF